MEHEALLTDKYQLTMAAFYHYHGLGQDLATFELYARRLPEGWTHLIAAGLKQALDYVRHLAFTDEDIHYLRTQPPFGDMDYPVLASFWAWLKQLPKKGLQVWAIPEGVYCYPNEPIVQVRGPLILGQLVETYLLSTVGYQTLVASKWSRIVKAAHGKPVIEFGTRRAHGSEAGVLAARAAWIAGAYGTSNLEAGRRFGIPTYGTMAHSLVMACDSMDWVGCTGEAWAFKQFYTMYRGSVLLIDTFDVRAALRKIVALATYMPSPCDIGGIRIDSQPLLKHARYARRVLDKAGLRRVKIFASGDLDEYRIAALEKAGAPIDVYCVGTQGVVPSDAPTLGCVYKLVEYKGSPVAKTCGGKSSLPGTKQVCRKVCKGGTDVITLAKGFKAAAERHLLVKAFPGRYRSVLQQARGRAIAALSAEHRQPEVDANITDLVQKLANRGGAFSDGRLAGRS